jgi:hypothetical protein
MAGAGTEAEHFSPYRADGKLVRKKHMGEGGIGGEADESLVRLCVCGHWCSAACWAGNYSGIGWYVDFSCFWGRRRRAW